MTQSDLDKFMESPETFIRRPKNSSEVACRFGERAIKSDRFTLRTSKADPIPWKLVDHTEIFEMRASKEEEGNCVSAYYLQWVENGISSMEIPNPPTAKLLVTDTLASCAALIDVTVPAAPIIFHGNEYGRAALKSAYWHRPTTTTTTVRSVLVLRPEESPALGVFGLWYKSGDPGAGQLPLGWRFFCAVNGHVCRLWPQAAHSAECTARHSNTHVNLCGLM